jgi:hypothetical protein
LDGAHLDCGNLLPPPTLGERGYRNLARGSVLQVFQLHALSAIENDVLPVQTLCYVRLYLARSVVLADDFILEHNSVPLSTLSRNVHVSALSLSPTTFAKAAIAASRVAS